MIEALRQYRPIEVESLSEEAAYAALAVELIATELDHDMPRTGRAAQDKLNDELRQSDRRMQAKVAPYDRIYFGHTNSYRPHLYNALIAGYKPTEAQIQACLNGGGYNFIWDEIEELHSEHGDIYEELQRFGYKHRQELSDAYPVSMPFVGAYAVPRVKMLSILMRLYQRGQQYRTEGLGFPWWSDEIDQSEEADSGR